jgi:aminopeptidase N
LRDIEDSVSRALIWGAAWDMTRDAEMSTTDYLNMVLGADLGSIEIGVAQQLLLQARSAIEQFGNPANRAANRDALAGSLIEALAKAEPGGDHQLAFVKNIAGLARTEDHISLIAGWLDGSATPAGLEVDTDLRWQIVARLVALGALPESAIDQELERDNTAGGQRQAASARAGIPTAEAKLIAWKSVIEDTNLANALLESTVGGFSQPDQRALLEPFVDKYFKVIGEVWETRTNEIAQTLTLGLFPSLLGSPEILAKADARAKPDIQRFKGLGEMMPKTLWETTLNPATRRLLRVDIDDQLETDRVVADLMGRDASARFNFIMDRAEDAQEIDV